MDAVCDLSKYFLAKLVFSSYHLKLSLPCFIGVSKFSASLNVMFLIDTFLIKKP